VITYLSNGTYVATGTPRNLGVYQIRLFLKQIDSSHLLTSQENIEVICSAPRLPMAGNASCGCVRRNN
jgi:2-keto-4-pentenoate hydratase/2-oxohepta-3-ene-1,7-dioic acid hydratase in catechol pathway